MTHNDGFERTVSAWLEEEPAHGVPDYLDEVLARTTRTRQRPAGRASKGGSPCKTTLRLVPGAQARLAAGHRRTHRRARRGGPLRRLPVRLPAPFGPAANGSIVYGTDRGDILAYDPVTGATSSIIAGTTKDETPDFSPDGTRVMFARETEVTDRWLLMVAEADGSDIRPVTGPLYPAWNAWAPDSTRVAVVDTAPAPDTLSIFGLDGSAPLNLPLDGLTPDRVQWRSATELVFSGQKGPTFGLYAISTDGSGPRPILPPSTTDSDWLQPVLSPDGTRLAWTKWVDGPVIQVIDIASGKVSTPVFSGTNDGDGWPTWSPDGTKLLFTRWNGAENHLAVGPASGGQVVEIGPGFADFTDGAVGVFSPDGTRIVARYGYDPLATWLLNPITGGDGDRLLTGVSGEVSWQRLAP